MDDFFALQTKAFKLWFDSMDANHNAMTTIAMRLPIMAGSSFSGRPTSPEMQRMISEKFEAALEGAMDGVLASGKLASNAMMGRLNPTLLADGMVDVANATHRPARLAVKANANRLTNQGQ